MEANDKSYALNETNPWKGLNFYKEGEVLYGRDDEIQSLALYVINNIQTVLYGKSGIGKSSIINAGVFPIARKEGLFPIPIRLKHDQDTTYIEQIRAAFAESGIGIKEILPAINEQEESLWEYLHRQTFYEKESNVAVRPLIVLDQFEEFFTLQHNESKKKAFFSELADLLNEVTPQYIIKAKNEADTGLEKQSANDNSGFVLDLGQSEPEETAEYITDSLFNIVFTIREDFLSYLERYTKFIPVMKSNRYALLPLNEEQAKDVIMKPIPGLVDIDVAKLIIQKVTGRTDFNLGNAPEIDVDAAVLSLYLSRLYLKKGKGNAITAELVDLSSRDIIKDFYEESVSDLPETDVEKIEDQLLTYDGRRNNVSRNDLISEGVSEKSIYTLVEDRKLLRQFSYQDDMRIEYMHDILCPIVNERIENREEAKQKAEEQRLQEEMQRKLLAEEQRKRDVIEAQAKADRQRMEEEAKEQKRKTRRIIIGFVTIAIIVGICVTFYYYYYKRIYSSYYKSYELVNGWPIGIEELSTTELGHIPLYYKLSHKGYKQRNTDIEVCSSNDMLPKAPRIQHLVKCSGNTPDSLSNNFYNLLSQVKYIHFEAGEKGKINKEIIMDEGKSVLFYVNYFHLETEGQAWVQYVSSHGQSMPICRNGLDRIKLTWIVTDKEKEKGNKGRISSLMYYDALGVPRNATNDVYGYSFVYSEDGLTNYRYLLNEFGILHNTDSTSYNVIITTANHDTVDIRYAHTTSFSDSLIPAIGPYGFWRELLVGDDSFIYLPDDNSPIAKRSFTKDSRGNIIRIKKEGKLRLDQPAIVKYTYSNTGLICSEEKLNLDSTRYVATDGIFLRKWEYDKNGEMISEAHFNNQLERVYYHFIEKNGDVVHDEIHDRKNDSLPVIIQIDTAFNNYHSISFYAADYQPINKKTFDSKVPFHRMVVKTDQKTKTTYYYNYSPLLNKVCCQPTTKDKYGTVLSYFKKVETFDDDNNPISYQIFDEQNHIVKSMMFFFQNGKQVGRAAMGIDGTPVRCPDWEEEGFGYYKLYYAKDFNNNYAGITPVNEWGKNSFFYDGYIKEYQTVSDFDFKGWFMHKTINDNENIEITNEYKQRIFKKDNKMTDTTIPYIHILDKKSPLYDNGNGLKDGDRLIKLENWKWKQSNDKLASAWQQLSKKPVEIEVLRPTADSFERLSFIMEATASELELAEYHCFALTPEELQILNNFIK